MFSSVLITLLATSLCQALVIPSSKLAPRASPATIITYPSVSYFNSSTIFGVTANAQSIAVPVVATYHTSTFAATANGLVTIVVTSLKAPISQFSLQPAGPDVAGAVVSGNTLTFTVQAPRKLEVRINTAVTYIGDTVASTVMYLVVDLPEVPAEIPSPTASGVLYFAPGVYNLGFMLYNATNLPPSQIYVAPGALVNAAWRFVGVKNVSISGRGFLRNPFQDKSQNMMYFAASQNIIIKDVFMVDSPQHVIALSSGSLVPSQCSQFLIDNIKSLHRGGNSDGFSYFGPTNNVVVQNVLLVNMDNQIVLQAGLPTGPYNNTFQNNIFVKANSAGNFIYINPNNLPTGIIGSGNLITNMDILRLSGENGLIQCDPANSVANIVLPNLRIVTLASRTGSNNNNYFVQMSSNDTTYPKSITFQNSQFPAIPTTGYNGAMLGGNWQASFFNVSFGGVPMTSDAQIGLTPLLKGPSALTIYGQSSS